MATSDSPQTGIYRSQHLGRETTMTIDASSVLRNDGTVAGSGTFNLTSSIVQLPGTLGMGFIDLGAHLFAARNAASGETVASGSSTPTAFWGGLLMPDGAPALGFDSTANRRLRLQWVSANVAAIVLPSITVPQDLATAGGMTLELYGETVGTASAADAAQSFTWTARFSALTSASTPADAGATAPDFTSTPAWSGITVASGSVATNQLSITLTPLAHANRAINVFGMRARYTKRTTSAT